MVLSPLSIIGLLVLPEPNQYIFQMYTIFTTAEGIDISGPISAPLIYQHYLLSSTFPTPDPHVIQPCCIVPTVALSSLTISLFVIVVLLTGLFVCYGKHIAETKT